MAILQLIFLLAVTIISSYGSDELQSISLDYKPTGNDENGLQSVNFIDRKHEVVNARMHTFQETIKMKIDPVEMSQRRVHCDESSNFILNEVPWSVKVCESDDFYNAKIIIELVSNFAGVSEMWSCEAEAAVKLSSTRQENKTLEFKLEKFKYSKSNPSKALKTDINWMEMFKNYTVDGVATFEFDVKAEIPNRSPKLEQISTKFQMRAKQVLKTAEQHSNELVVQGIRWIVVTSKQQDNLAVFLWANENDVDITKSWKTSATIKLLHPDEKRSISKSIPETTLDWTQTKIGISDFMKWNEFANKEDKFVRNNAALFEIELHVQLN